MNGLREFAEEAMSECGGGFSGLVLGGAVVGTAAVVGGACWLFGRRGNDDAEQPPSTKK